MRAKKFFGITVLDKNVKEVGKIDDVEIDTETGKVITLIVSLKKGILSNDEIEVNFEDIATIGDYILLSTEIDKEEKAEDVKVEVEVEDE
ncbi:MAG: PRC-barrel domain-containing protein [Methanobrevibacter sp.]|nr:PRC-barrel domain-containing protein [Methanobrevibacter sp.]